LYRNPVSHRITSADLIGKWFVHLRHMVRDFPADHIFVHRNIDRADRTVLILNRKCGDLRHAPGDRGADI
jgi:hypothetical protein